MKLTQIEKDLLWETIEWFKTDTNRRCISGHTCIYSPKSNPNSNTQTTGCAIGRKLRSKDLQTLDNLSCAGIGDVYNASKGLGDDTDHEEYAELSTEIKEEVEVLWTTYNILFLDRLQNLHDSNEFWDYDIEDAKEWIIQVFGEEALEEVAERMEELWDKKIK